MLNNERPTIQKMPHQKAFQRRQVVLDRDNH